MQHNKVMHKCLALLTLVTSLFPIIALANNGQDGAQIELCTGDIRLTKADKTAGSSSALMAGDSLQTASHSNSRCRVGFVNGSSLNIGPDTTVRFDGNQHVTLLQGQLVAYAMPELDQPEQPLILQLNNGELLLTLGKVFASLQQNKPQVAIFNDLVAATWHDAQGEKVLYPGNLLDLASENTPLSRVERTMEANVSEQTSPEIPAVKQASLAFKNKDFITANRLFQQIQRAFPYNASAAYYLGLFALQDNKVIEAVDQWKKYVAIDPQNAKNNGVMRQLTLMNSRAIQDDVKQRIANEKALSQQPPEPNSIAVYPLVNKGAEQYQAIGKGLTAFIITDLAKVPGLKVLEREKLQKLMDEIKLSEQNGLVTKPSQVRAGHIMRAEKLMLGDYLIESTKGAQ